MAEVYRTPDAQALLYFAFFHPDRSHRRRRSATCRRRFCAGMVVAITSYAFFELVGGADYLLVGVLAGNVISPWFLLSIRPRTVAPSAITNRGALMSP